MRQTTDLSSTKKFFSKVSTDKSQDAALAARKTAKSTDIDYFSIFNHETNEISKNNRSNVTRIDI